MNTNLLRKLRPLEYVEVGLNRVRITIITMLTQQDERLDDGITSAEANAVVQLERTKVACGVKIEVAAPALMAKTNGYFIVNVLNRKISGDNRNYDDLDTMNSVMTTHLTELLQRSKFVELSSLNHQESGLVYTVYCDVVVLENDGSLLDACLTACTACLRKVRLPNIVIGDDGIVRADCKCNEQNSTLLHTGAVPTITTFAVISKRTLYGQYIKIFDQDGYVPYFVLQLMNTGGIPVSQELINKAFECVNEKHSAVLQAILQS